MKSTRYMRQVLGALGLMICLAGLPRAEAQQTVPAPPPGASVVQSSKSIWPGLAVTVLACGLGIFAVVKSSTRN